MSRKLVAYFSVSGTTAQVAEKLAEAIGQIFSPLRRRFRTRKQT